MQKLAYEQLMEEHGLTIGELPEDAQIGIQGVKKIAHAINMAEKRKQNIQPATIQKLKANDKWAIREILDYIDEKDSNQGDLPNNPEEVIDELNGEQLTPEEKANHEKGMLIEKELEGLAASGKSQFSASEIRSMAPKAYSAIFEGYDDEEENGVATSKFSLIEDSQNKEMFNLK